MSQRNTRSVSTSFEVYRDVNSSSSGSSTSSSSSSKSSDTPLWRFNRLLRTSVAWHWGFFRRNQLSLKSRGRSVSDAGLCTIADNDLYFLDIPVSPRRSLQVFNSASAGAIPELSKTSVGGSSAVGLEEASDGSDAERSRRHLRVPTPTYLSQ
ncbi:uncharacterized protein LOC120632660 [Pararge aegeria]|uniref:Jg12345 protein n=1 Tax=Pararge aegeria aegeria TaxID=348720 RepID=A0A8S4R7V2_9NEOP|nr:uncharacterized protein LOC120632660 [Pararge aegeria]CAH2232186.1 jg12345 [Pararge aegeria aegeria]